MVTVTLGLLTAGSLGSQAAASGSTGGRAHPAAVPGGRPAVAYLTDPNLRPHAESTGGRLGSLSHGAVAPEATAPSRSWQGIYDASSWPTAPVSAIGPTRYVEVTNSNIGDGYAVYDRTHNTPLLHHQLYYLTGCADANCFNVSPQVMWDPTTKRFYYTAESFPPGPGQVGYIMFGFSKTSAPSGTSAWCSYQSPVGTNFADEPRLGDSKDFMVVGYDLFDGTSEQFLGARMAAFAKVGGSAPITTCPSSITGGSSGRLKDANGKDVFEPTPANETDSDATGWVVARTVTLPSTSLVLFQVTRTSSGAPSFHVTGTTVPVASYKAPPAAPQKGTSDTISLGQAGPTRAVAAVDPGHGGTDAIWVQHTVAGGAGSIMRWYEINPVAHDVLQQGSVSFRDAVGIQRRDLTGPGGQRHQARLRRRHGVDL